MTILFTKGYIKSLWQFEHILSKFKSKEPKIILGRKSKDCYAKVDFLRNYIYGHHTESWESWETEYLRSSTDVKSDLITWVINFRLWLIRVNL